MSRPLSLARNKSNYYMLNGKKMKSLLYYVMIVYQWWRQRGNESIVFFLFLKQPVVNEIGVRRKDFLYSFMELFLYYHQEQQYNRTCFMKYTCSFSALGAELWWPNFSFPPYTGIHRSSTVSTLSNRQSWLAFPSHWRKHKSLLFSCITASMHFPERTWTIIPFSWKSQCCWWMAGPSSVQFWRITCSRLTSKHRCCGLPKRMSFLPVCSRCCCCRLSLQGASVMAQPRMSPSAWQSAQKPSPVLWSFPENLGLCSDGYNSG